jgi:anti-sigma factor RsiW
MCHEHENLVAYLYDEADASERRAVEAHLSTCEECRDEIRGFRAVREDLLAWDVPPHTSVWTPFVTTPRPAPVWRQTPAWAMLAAATLVFAVGAAGGGLTARLLARDSRGAAPANTVAASTTAAPTAAAPSAEAMAEMAALSARIAELERVAHTQPAPVATASAPNEQAYLAKVEQLIRESEGRVNQRTANKILSVFQDMARQHAVDYTSLQQQISDAQAQTQTYGNLLRVMNSREKEKEY